MSKNLFDWPGTVKNIQLKGNVQTVSPTYECEYPYTVVLSIPSFSLSICCFPKVFFFLMNPLSADEGKLGMLNFLSFLCVTCFL
jgi:hypothetical protein